MRLTKNFIRDEFFVSATHPQEARIAKWSRDEKSVDYLYYLQAEMQLQPTRDFINAEFLRREGVVRDLQIVITSGYRDAALNKLTPGSSGTSLHMSGKATDWIIPGHPDYLWHAYNYIKGYLFYGELFLYVDKKTKLPRNIHSTLPICGSDKKARIIEV